MDEFNEDDVIVKIGRTEKQVVLSVGAYTYCLTSYDRPIGSSWISKDVIDHNYVLLERHGEQDDE